MADTTAYNTNYSAQVVGNPNSNAVYPPPYPVDNFATNNPQGMNAGYAPYSAAYPPVASAYPPPVVAPPPYSAAVDPTGPAAPQITQTTTVVVVNQSSPAIVNDFPQVGFSSKSVRLGEYVIIY